MLSNKSKIRKILVVSLTNIGDVILTLPVIDILLRDFPEAKLSVVVSPKAQALLKGNHYFHRVYVFDKRQPWWKTVPWVVHLLQKRFDLVVDLRNTAIPFLIAPRYRTPAALEQKNDVHMKQKHLQRLLTVYHYAAESEGKQAVVVSPQDTELIHQIIENAFGKNPSYIVVAPGAADQTKQWPVQGFVEVCYQLMKRYNIHLVLVGDENDRVAVNRIAETIGPGALNLCGRTTLPQLAAVIQRAQLVLANDSAPMHLASYLDVPVLALFGPTDARKYGPWGAKGRFIQRNQFCPACQNPKDAPRHTCMGTIITQDVLNAFQWVQGKVVFSRA
ncbi:MAG: glycosyltransferase family 9 protein [Candidatus Omnitrophica bacterium]|nr:glycosyltransferase family 9 protein [Candidatus Omnitrophota bacterium]